MKSFFTFLICLNSILLLNAQTIWIIEPAHSSIQFEVPHLTVSTVTGYFTSFSGKVYSSGKDFENAQIQATIDANSITTHNLERDKHLRDEDFLNSKIHPQILFKSTEFIKNKDGTYQIKGDLTIKNTTRSVILQAAYVGIILINDKTKAGFTAKGRINRFDYGLKWNDALDNGGLIVGEDVDILLNITLILQ